eukprot:SAG22_NODE_6244_length_881_cov_1.054987_1_plen_52_part_00
MVRPFLEALSNILKIQEGTQRTHDELQSAWDEIDKNKKSNTSDDDYLLITK